MSLVTDAYLLEKYGPRLDTDQLADALSMNAGTIRNQVSAGTFAVKTYLEGNRRFADYRDVSAYFDEARARAITAAREELASVGRRGSPTTMSVEQASAQMLHRLERLRPKEGDTLAFDNAWNGLHAYVTVLELTLEWLWKRVDALESKATATKARESGP